MILTGKISRYGSGRFGFIEAVDGKEYHFSEESLSTDLMCKPRKEGVLVEFQTSGIVPLGKACAVATHIREERA